MPMFGSSCQHYDEQQFSYTLICTVVKLDLFIQALLLDHNLVLEKKYVYDSRASCCFSNHSSVSHCVQLIIFDWLSTL